MLGRHFPLPPPVLIDPPTVLRQGLINFLSCTRRQSVFVLDPLQEMSHPQPVLVVGTLLDGGLEEWSPAGTPPPTSSQIVAQPGSKTPTARPRLGPSAGFALEGIQSRSTWRLPAKSRAAVRRSGRSKGRLLLRPLVPAYTATWESWRRMTRRATRGDPLRSTQDIPIVSAYNSRTFMWAGKFHRLATAIFHRSHRPGPTSGRAPTGPQGGPSALVGFGRPFGSLSLTFPTGPLGPHDALASREGSEGRA